MALLLRCTALKSLQMLRSWSLQVLRSLQVQKWRGALRGNHTHCRALYVHMPLHMHCKVKTQLQNARTASSPCALSMGTAANLRALATTVRTQCVYTYVMRM